MAQPFMYVATSRIMEGKFDEVSGFWQEVVAAVEEHEPQIIGFNAFADEDRSEITVLQLHPDTASMDLHMKFIGEQLSQHVARALGPEMLQWKHAEYYGTPSESSLEMDRSIPGMAVDIKPVHVGGFTRSTI